MALCHALPCSANGDGRTHRPNEAAWPWQKPAGRCRSRCQDGHCFTRLHWVAAERASVASDSAPYPVPTPPSSSDEDVLMCPFAGSPDVRGKEERRRSTVVSEILGMCVGLMSIGLMSIGLMSTCCALGMAVRSGYGDGRWAGWGVRGKGIMIHHRWWHSLTDGCSPGRDGGCHGRCGDSRREGGVPTIGVDRTSHN